MVINTKIDKSFKYFIIAGSICMLFILIFIQVWAAYYSVYSADDFSAANSLRPYGDSAWDYLLACFRHVKEIYLGWQGSYFSSFIATIINPLSQFGLPQLRVEMILNVLLFFSSLIFLIHVIFNNVIKENYHIKWFACACIVYVIMNSRTYPEVFFWFIGVVTYSFSIICLFFSLGFFILSNTKSKHRILFAVLASLLSVGSQGGSLAITGAGCYIILVLCLAFWLQSKKLSVMNLVVAFIFMAGALVNVVAPGNYIRHAHFETGIHPIAVIAPTIRQYFQEIKLIISNDQFRVIFLLLILCGAILYGKVQSDIKIYTAISLLLLITPIVTIFPVMLGYAGNADMPNRVLFIINAVTVMVYANAVMVAGYWIAAFMKVKAVKPVWLLCPLSILLLAFLVRVFIVSEVRDTVMVGTLRQLYHGRVQDYYTECTRIYEYIAESSEADVVIENYPQRIDGFGIFELYPDPNEWVNTCVAEYYYKNSVRTTG